MNPPAPAATESPFDVVLQAMSEGSPSRRAVAAKTGMSEGLVDALFDHLLRAGRITTIPTSGGCPPQGCGGCASGGRSDSGCAERLAGADLMRGPVGDRGTQR